MLRITQTGTGNAFVVEDSTNPDVTPFVIAADGKVSIGTSSTVANLEVMATGANGILLGKDTSSAQSSRLFFSNGTDGQHTTILNSNNGSIDFRTLATAGSSTGTQRMLISAAGMVNVLEALGVNQPSPTARLHIISGTTYSGAIISGTSDQDMVRITQTGTGNALVVEDSTNPDASPFVVTSTGAVGMGTGNPSYSAHVYSTTAQLLVLERSTANNVNVQLKNSASSMILGIDASSNFHIGSAGDFTALGSTFKINRSNGYVGVGLGTYSVDNTLHVKSTTSGAVKIEDGTQQAGYVLTSDANGVATWQASTGGGASVTNFGDNRIVTSTGTTTGLNGEANLTFDGSTLTATANTTSVPLIIASGSSTQDMLRITQTGTGNAFVVEDASNPDSSSFIINNNGKVGVGSDPTSFLSKMYVFSTTVGDTGLRVDSAGNGVEGRASKLDKYGLYGENIIDGAGTVTGVYGVASGAEGDNSATTFIGGKFISTSNGGASTQVYSLWLQDGTEATDGILTSMTSDGKANWKNSIKVTSIIASASSTGDIVRITQTGTGNALVVEDSANPDATPFIVHTTGFVGVGTASPGNNLHVQGSMKLTGTFSGNNTNFVQSELITQTVLLYMSNNT